MITNETKKLVAQATLEELKNAQSFGEFYNSPHEGWAVLKEEVEEARENLAAVENYLQKAWDNIRKNDSEELTANMLSLNSFSLMLIYEALQVYAVSEKAWRSFTGEA